MDVLLARQPVLDARLDVFGYELLFRAPGATSCDTTDGVAATQHVVANSLLQLGLGALLGGKRGLVNFPRELLLSDFASLLPPHSLIIEILEDVRPDREVVKACERLRRQGWSLALDDVTPSSPHLELAPYADIVKVDFLETSPEDQWSLSRSLESRGIRMLAEKVETPEQFEWARTTGYSYFQGYFFARPNLVSKRGVRGFRANYLAVLAELNQPEPSTDVLETLLRREPTLCQRLLTYANSAVFTVRSPVSSIRQALIILGQDTLLKCTLLAGIPQLTADKPAELAVAAVLRARFCELAAEAAGAGGKKSQAFLLGMFSLLDALLDMPMKEAVEQVQLAPEVSRILLGGGGDSDMTSWLRLSRAYEAAEWAAVERESAAAGLPAERLQRLYADAVGWTDPLCAAYSGSRGASVPHSAASRAGGRHDPRSETG